MLELIDLVRDIIVCPMLLTTFLSFIVGVAFFIIGGVSSIVGLKKESAVETAHTGMQRKLLKLVDY